MEKKEKNERPVTVHITNHNKFEKGVGAFITNLNHLTLVMDAEGNMKMDMGNVPVMPHTETDTSEPIGQEECQEESVEVKVKYCIVTMKKEKVLRYLYDYTWIMEVMNQTQGMPNFNTPISFISYLKDLDIDLQLPSEDTINKKQNAFTGTFPDWQFTDCDTTEANRRINVGKRFLNIYRNI